ncbi:hypothetical protein RUND412_009916 [Rhizina undulata]
MHQKRVLLLLSSSVTAALASAPQGVSPEDASLYTGTAEGTFRCITHPSVIIPASQINDDYCDCPDGSDEPGTSGCAHLPHKNLAIPGFYCRNSGHTPSYLPLSRVNDGICDYEFCCDGSDEYARVGGVVCENRCAEIGAEAKKLKEERLKARTEGVRKRDELIRKAVVARKEVEDNIVITQTKLEGMQLKVKRLEEDLKETEIKERAKLAQASKPPGRAALLVETAKQRTDELKTALVKLKESRDDNEHRLKEAEAILEALKVEYNPNFNDEGVKKAVRAWEEYLAAGNAERAKNVAEEGDLEQLLNGEGINWDEILDVEEPAGDAAVYGFEHCLPAGAGSWIRKQLDGLRQMAVENGILPDNKEAGTLESKAVNAARDALSAAQREHEDSRKHLTTLEEDLRQPYGPSDVFRTLKGECISREFGEYKYEYCFLTKAFQKSLKDSSSTPLGEFARIEIVDTASHNDAAGLFESGWEEAHEEKVSGIELRHENGQACWNGPKRSARIELFCSQENEIRNVVEEEKCVYKFEIGTPAVCESFRPKGEELEDRVRDEL